jgi:hypothetical protein
VEGNAVRKEGLVKGKGPKTAAAAAAAAGPGDDGDDDVVMTDQQQQQEEKEGGPGPRATSGGITGDERGTEADEPQAEVTR